MAWCWILRFQMRLPQNANSVPPSLPPRHTPVTRLKSGTGENHLSRAIVGTDLNSRTSRNELSTFDRVTHGLSTGVVIAVADVQVKETLFVRQCAIFVDLVTADLLRMSLRYGEQPWIRAAGHTGGELQSVIDA